MSAQDLSPLLSQELQAIQDVHMPTDTDNQVASMIARFCKAVACAYTKRSCGFRGHHTEQYTILHDLETVRDKLRKYAQSYTHERLQSESVFSDMYHTAVKFLLVSHSSNLYRKTSEPN